MGFQEAKAIGERSHGAFRFLSASVSVSVSDSGAELMRLQGIDFAKPLLAEYSENQVTDLAGNAPL